MLKVSFRSVLKGYFLLKVKYWDSEVFLHIKDINFIVKLSLRAIALHGIYESNFCIINFKYWSDIDSDVRAQARSPKLA
jgi:hypothetical protein